MSSRNPAPLRSDRSEADALRAVLQITRPQNCVITFASVLMGGWLGAHALPATLWIAALSAAAVMAGVGDGPAEIELDRRRAIAAALDGCRPGDVVIVAGKGHETTQTIGERIVPFDDRAEVRRVLGAAGSGVRAR